MPDQLLKNADMALYRAKADGRGIYPLLRARHGRPLQERRALEIDLRTALANGEFDLFYQPLINVGTSQISGFEALLRWRHPDRGMVPPGEFIPRGGRDRAHRPARRMGAASGLPRGRVAGRPTSRLRSTCRPHSSAAATWFRSWPARSSPSGLAPGRLELEITESVLLHDNEARSPTCISCGPWACASRWTTSAPAIRRLSYLRSFPFDKIKIDRSFVRDISERADCAAIVQSIASLGASLGMATTAEGVETGEQLQLLKAVGCTEVQGYYFARPQPAGEARRLLENRASAAA